MYNVQYVLQLLQRMTVKKSEDVSSLYTNMEVPSFCRQRDWAGLAEQHRQMEAETRYAPWCRVAFRESGFGIYFGGSPM